MHAGRPLQGGGGSPTSPARRGAPDDPALQNFQLPCGDLWWRERDIEQRAPARQIRLGRSGQSVTLATSLDDSRRQQHLETRPHLSRRKAQTLGDGLRR